MSIDQIAIFSIIGASIILFIWDKWRYDIIALMALFASVVAGVVKPSNAFTGFSDPVVVTVACILVISAAVSRSGFIDVTLKMLSRFTEKPKLQITVLVLMVMVLSAFMNNVGALAVFLPITIAFARKANRKPSELLMPLAFGSLLGGLVTLIGTPPNLLISRIREDVTGSPYEMFDFAPVGLGICALGLVYLSFGWRLLPKNRRGQPSPEEQFAIEDYITELRATEDTLILGKTVHELEALLESDLSVIGIIHENDRRMAPSGSSTIALGDVLMVETDPMTLKKCIDKTKLVLVGSKETDEISLTSDEIAVTEAVIREGSDIIGLTPRQLQLRSRFNVNLLALRQATIERKQSTMRSRFALALFSLGSVNEPERTRMRDTRFREGDILVLQGNADAMPETLATLGCLPLAERSLQLGRRKQTFLPALILAICVLLTMADVMPISIAFLGGVIAIALMKILRLNEMYESIDGPVLILLGAMIPVTAALQSTGGTEIIASAINAFTAGLSGPVMIGAIMVASMLVTPFLNNAATVLLMAPIAATLATKMGVSVDPFLMAVAVGTSCDFLTPIGHQSNTLVMGPGGYKFSDYWRLGLPLSIMVVVAGVPLILAVWPL